MSKPIVSRGVEQQARLPLSPAGPSWSSCNEQHDAGIIAHASDGFQRHLSGAANGAVVILIPKDCADITDTHVFVVFALRRPGAAIWPNRQNGLSRARFSPAEVLTP